ncbi:MAG: transcription antitermination factor NusB [Elusimicrobiota bacterium]
MGSRRDARECALQIVYLIDVCDIELEEAIKCVFSFHQNPENTTHVMDQKTVDFTVSIVKGTVENMELIDKWIRKYAVNWEIERMATVDRCILRMAICEFMTLLDVPINVVIDEAVELAKKFSTNDSSKFVNGILDKVKAVRGSKPEDKVVIDNGTINGQQ